MTFSFEDTVSWRIKHLTLPPSLVGFSGNPCWELHVCASDFNKDRFRGKIGEKTGRNIKLKFKKPNKGKRGQTSAQPLSQFCSVNYTSEFMLSQMAGLSHL